MTRLELIMTENKNLTVDDARALLSDHLEGTLEAAARAQVDALLASDAGLRKERADLARTVEALRALPRLESSGNMVANVRDRLAAERRSEAAKAQADSGGTVVPRSRFRWGGVEAAIGLAAAASIAVFVMVVGMPKGAPAQGGDTMTAGIGAAQAAVEATLVAPGMSREVLVELATKAGMDTITADAFEGEGRAAARFVLMLKSEGLARGVEVSGMVPDGARVRLTVKTSP